MIGAVSTIRNILITGDGILGWEFVIDEKLVKDSVMESVPIIINFVVIGDGRLGWKFVIDGILGKDSVM